MPGSNTRWWAIGGATRCESAIDLAKLEPDNAHLLNFQREGLATCRRSGICKEKIINDIVD